MVEQDKPKKEAIGGELAPDDQSDAAKPDDILRTIISHIRNGKTREAYFEVQDAALEFPDDPFILSFYGWLQALVDRRYRIGVDKCKLALSMIQKNPSFGGIKHYPAFYLNLGKAYVAAGKKKDALEAFNNGLKYDKKNRDILQELKTLGSRKKAPVPFLDRSNPINKYVGMILNSGKKDTAKKK